MGRMQPIVQKKADPKSETTKTDGSNILFNQIFQGEMSDDQEKRIREQSPFKHLKTWSLLRLIIKSNDDLRSE